MEQLLFLTVSCMAWRTSLAKEGQCEVDQDIPQGCRLRQMNMVSAQCKGMDLCQEARSECGVSQR
eukprot:139045-Amphidinium_carterae.1